MILCLYNVDALNICMKEFIIYVCTDSTEIFFSKLRSAGLNYNLSSIFTDSYCAGVSNKHCLLTFLIYFENLDKRNLYIELNVITTNINGTVVVQSASRRRCVCAVDLLHSDMS